MKTKSCKWCMVSFAYILDTIRINSQTICSLAKDLEPRKTNSFDYGIELSRALAMPSIESRPLNGLQSREQRKMAFILQRAVGRFGVEAGRPVVVAAAGAAAAMQGAAAAARNAARSMTQFAQQAEREGRFVLCLHALPSEGHKQEKNKLGRIKTCCGTCGNHVCKKHFNIICEECSALFMPRP